jgi:hypothetical protein
VFVENDTNIADKVKDKEEMRIQEIVPLPVVCEVIIN